MRILHLDAGREMRGGQWQVLRLIEGLTGAGVESTLLARAGAPLAAAARERGWRVEALGFARAAMLARRHDLIHAHDARSHTLGAIVRGAPLVVARRVAFPVGSRWKYARARYYLAVSEFVRRVLTAGGVPDEKISVVYDGVPVLDPSAGSRVLALANLDDPQKGAPVAMEAARLAGVELLLTHNLEHDLPQAASFVYITHAEGLGSAALLAMSAAVPVIASRVGGLPEVVRHRETGLLVDNAPAAVADALLELAGDAAFARRLGQAARRAVVENFTVDHMVRRTMEVYHKVLS
ncbi:MAG: glycosyltransferase family 4 protein [Bryobacteraceae bacterium]|jgi:glycosyltransferase involved in cell wall biosynthesis